MIPHLLPFADRARSFAETYATETKDFRPSLAGMCAIASAYLFKMLTEYNQHAVIVLAGGNAGQHCYVRSGEYMIDVTATQFHPTRDTKIVVQPFPSHEPHWFWSTINHQFTSIDQLIAFQQADHWWPEQIAYHERLDPNYAKRNNWRQPQCAPA